MDPMPMPASFSNKKWQMSLTDISFPSAAHSDSRMKTRFAVTRMFASSSWPAMFVSRMASTGLFIDRARFR